MTYLAVGTDFTVAVCRDLLDTRGRFLISALVPVERQSLPTDPVGVFTLTLTNLVAGSAIQIEPQAGGAALYTGTAGASTVVVPLQAYAPGSPNNSLRIKVRKGTTSPFYQPFETQATATVGAQTIFVSQIPDE